MIRLGLATVLGAGRDIEVVGESADGAGALDAVARLRPDVVMMDIRMPGMDGLAATEALRTVAGAPAVIVLTTFDTDDHILRALRAGASGFLLKDTPPLEIIDAVRRVAGGESMLSPSVVGRLIEHVVRDEDRGDRIDRVERARSMLGRLTEREREVAEAVGQGLSNAEISVELFMSVATVKAYVSRVLTKMDCANRVQVAILVHDARG
ncbi:response regulator transcription factor [Polymorphospora rubra]|uniref:DNA-binding response regulator n=2 Tax=Polymorphospora rubra TaxID=338584 RepID=A0A810MTZ4_9ACTN|nr:DNA-binding response regulator [Polymorphospora rubra]